MDSPKPGLDLEKELTCSVCTELLYQPLTLLDCLHTFCGACLKEWFSFQANAARRSPTPPTPQTVIFTCPSCRASVRDTRHNATVVTLLDMLVAANPDKDRAASEKEEMAAKYAPGEQILPTIETRERTAAERRADEEDERLVREVREMSLQEARGELSVPPRTRRHRASRSAGDESRSRREESTGSANRQPRDGSHRSRAQGSRRPSTERGREDGGGHRRQRRSESQQRQVEHQSSLRSLISSGDMNERDIEREIEDFAQQIQAEGLLEGLDLDNIDLSRDDELSRRITEAYRRRQRERATRGDATRRGHTSSQSTSNRNSDSSQAEHSRHLAPDGNGTATRPTSGSRPGSATSQTAVERSRPPPSMTTNLEPPNPARRPRRRTASGGRSATTPVFSSTISSSDARPGAQSQTDLTLRTRTSDPAALRPSVGETRSSSTPSASAAASPPPPQTDVPADGNGSNASFASRMPRETAVPSPPTRTPPEPAETPGGQLTQTQQRPAELASESVRSPTTTGSQQPRSLLYPEPSITCSACGKPHIEYDVFYNCASCFGGQWNLCLSCYRTGQGCHYWFGFGYAAHDLWERTRQKQGNGSLASPHVMSPRRYLPPPSTPGGADGRKTLTKDDPKNRLQTGTFCAGCLAWANDCYWRCYFCNDGEWGFCNDCVNQGRSCSHMLLPLSQEAPSPLGLPSTPRSPARPPAASLLGVGDARDPTSGGFQPLTFKTRCDICQESIPPSRVRYHCFECVSTLVPDSSPGDYDICSACYGDLVDQGRISEENGFNGWRRCLSGHRMIVVGFAESKDGQWRYVERDLVGGLALHKERLDSSDGQGLEQLSKWSWKINDQKQERLVTEDVAATAPRSHASLRVADTFPPDGGVGAKATAKWAWYPQDGEENGGDGDDGGGQELMFPRGAEISEVENLNDEWMCGTYMGSDGAFPAPLVTLKED